MRYHLWFVHFSRNEPQGVLDSGAVTGAYPACPLLRRAVRAAAPRCIHAAVLSPLHQPEVLFAELAALLFLFFAVRKL